MAGAFAIRRLRLVGLAPRDHPAPRDLAARLADAARAELAPALMQKLQRPSDNSVLRIRRLAVDVTLGATFDPQAFVELLAGAIATELARMTKAAEAGGTTKAENNTVDSETVVRFSSRAAYLAALLEAIAAGQAVERWWLREAAEGLRFLSSAAAIRTALLADPADGHAAFISFPTTRRLRLLSALGLRESERVLDAFAAAASATLSVEAAVAAIIAAAEIPEVGEPTPLALYLRATSAGCAGGTSLAAAARLWIRLAAAFDRPHDRDSLAWREWLAGAAPTPPEAAGHVVPEPARVALSESLARHRASGGLVAPASIALAERGSPTLSRFAGLLLLVPGLDLEAIAARVADWPGAPGADMASLIGYASLGLCAGRQRFAAWMDEPIWRELFGLDRGQSSVALMQRLSAIAEPEWRMLEPLGLAPDSRRNARFLLPSRVLIGAQSRVAARGLAALAYAAADRFRHRLNGLREPSTPFLWENLLGAGGVLTPVEGGWQARLSRPPLDVLLSLSRLAEGVVRLPGGDIQITRVAA